MYIILLFYYYLFLLQLLRLWFKVRVVNSMFFKFCCGFARRMNWDRNEGGRVRKESTMPLILSVLLRVKKFFNSK